MLLLALAAATAQPVFPVAAAEAVCRLYVAAPKRDQETFWERIDQELQLNDRQRVEVRLFCLGYQRGLLAPKKAAARR